MFVSKQCVVEKTLLQLRSAYVGEKLYSAIGVTEQNQSIDISRDQYNIKNEDPHSSFTGITANQDDTVTRTMREDFHMPDSNFYLELENNPEQRAQILNMFRCMVICNSVRPRKDGPSFAVYKEDLAIVEAAQAYGVNLIKRTHKNCEIEV
jgi:hypothetical protein